MAPLLPADVTVTRLSRSIHLYCRPGPAGSPGPRPLLLLLPWLGARPAAQGEYLQLYLACGFDVLAVESALSHFLCPRRGLRWAAHVLALLQGPGALASRPLVVHALSLGGYTFAQMLLLMGQDLGRHGSVAQRLKGHIFDSLVMGHRALARSSLLRDWASRPRQTEFISKSQRPPNRRVSQPLSLSCSVPGLSPQHMPPAPWVSHPPDQASGAVPQGQSQGPGSGQVAPTGHGDALAAVEPPWGRL